MKVLVTGGAGYIGSVLVRKLADKYSDILVYDNFVFGGEHLIPFNFQFGDIKDISPNVISRYDIVVHLAAMVFIGGDELGEHVMGTNFVATKKLVDICSLENKKFIFLSTCSNYGVSEDVVDESSPLMCTNIYSRSKIMCEEYIKNKENLDFVILRMSTVFGLSPRMRFDLTINEMTLEAFMKKKLVVFNPDAWRPGIHVDDAASAIVFAIENDLKGIFNVGGNRLNYQKKQLYNDFRSLISDLKIVEKKSYLDTRNYRVCFDKIKNIGWEPEFTITDGIIDIIDALENHVFVDPFDKRYKNLEWYQSLFG